MDRGVGLSCTPSKWGGNLYRRIDRKPVMLSSFVNGLHLRFLSVALPNLHMYGCHMRLPIAGKNAVRNVSVNRNT